MELIFEKVVEGFNNYSGNIFFWQWEMDFLQSIQHIDWLTVIMKIFTLAGEAGICWIALSIILVLFPKTRKCGFTMMFAMAITFIVGNLILKNSIARFRPGWVDENFFLTIKNGIKNPHDFSFPSGHTMNGITASFCIFFYNKGKGLIAIVVAGIIAFSRMYFFVHWPTDIFAGILIGIIDAVISFFVMKAIFGAIQKKHGDIIHTNWFKKSK